MLTIIFIMLLSVRVYAPGDGSLPLLQGEPAKPYEALWSAVCFVESSNNPFAVGDKHLKEQSYGIAMIRQSRLDDYFRQTGIRYTITEMFDTVKARRVFMWYAVGTDLERISRCWNGGNRGMEKQSTIDYWHRVNESMQSAAYKRFRREFKEADSVFNKIYKPNINH